MLEQEPKQEEQKSQLVSFMFKEFDRSLTEEEITGIIGQIFDYMYEGKLREWSFIDLRDFDGRAIMFGDVVSKKPEKSDAELSDEEKRLKELKNKHFKFSEFPPPEYAADEEAHTLNQLLTLLWNSPQISELN